MQAFSPKLTGWISFWLMKKPFLTWRCAERKTMSARVFGQRCLDEKILLLSGDLAGRVGDFQMDVSEIWKQGTISNMFGEEIQQYYQDLVRPCLELDLSDTETTFILCQLVWNYAGRRLQGQTMAAGEVFLERISNDLNTYYSNQNYAGRLGKMMRVVNSVLVGLVAQLNIWRISRRFKCGRKS
uniref:NR LBD domain-containing protein n=1 Tax=Caenorhabditis tropicalis TaxID=1561998 RepID=A0A1I7TI65_9PELO